MSAMEIFQISEKQEGLKGSSPLGGQSAGLNEPLHLGSLYYGISNKYIDITQTCLDKLTHNNIITIPNNDNVRAEIFGDPCYLVKKKIFISYQDSLRIFDDTYTIYIDLTTFDITSIQTHEIDSKLKQIHDQLSMKHGNFSGELPEQKMSVRYLSGSEKVLEIGGNIGRNTLVIASILQKYLKDKESSSEDLSLVTLECDPISAKKLEENRDLNHLCFFVEKSALSKRKLIQKEWDTIPSDKLLPGYKWVNTITLDELRTKYMINFDTLVLDCEGAFYYILQDMPEILDGIKLIIMENDYHDITHKKYVDSILTNNSFYRDYYESGGWGPCAPNFFEVWKRSTC